MPLGHRGSANPATILASLVNKREKLQDELRNMEKQVTFFFLVNFSLFFSVDKFLNLIDILDVDLRVRD